MIRSRKYLIAAVLLLSLGLTLLSLTHSRRNGSDRPDEPSVSINQLLTNQMSDLEEFSKFDADIRKFLKRWEIKGASFAIMKDNRLMYSKGYGWADEERKEEMTPGHIFRLASLSKLITATAVMQLCEKGLLTLNDTVFGPRGILNMEEFSRLRDRRMKDITVNQLLRHEAGFTLHKGDPLFTTREIILWEKLDTVPTMDEVIRYALGERLGYTPGKGYRYSNLGYLILTKIIETVSGQEYESYCQEHILHPIGCFDMHLAHNLYEEKYPNEVRYYETHDAEPVLSYVNNGDTLFKRYGGCDIHGLLGAGAWVASPSEYIRFVSSIDGNDSFPDILSDESIREMTSDPADLSHPIGWMKVNSQGDWSRTGTLPGTSALVKKDRNGYIWMFITNTSSWKGSAFTRYINYMYQKASRGINWPERDLFEYVRNQNLTTFVE